MQLSEFDYDLPEDLIAQAPLPARGSSRLMHLDGESGAISDHRFEDLARFFRRGDLMVFNDTQVIKARLFGVKDSGGKVEIMIDRVLDAGTALAFLALIAILRNSSWRKRSSRVLLGAGSAAIAVAMFPLVKFATGIPACVHPASAVPLSIFFAPVAIVFSAVTVPLGFFAGEQIRASSERMGLRMKNTFLRQILSPATLALCLALVLLFRLVVETNF